MVWDLHAALYYVHGRTAGPEAECCRRAEARGGPRNCIPRHAIAEL